MELTADNKFKKLIVVGDRVLIRPKKDEDRTKSGLYLPQGVKEKEQVQSGYIIKAGPGYPIPLPMEEDEPWKDKEENVKYVPLQAREGDLAIFLQKGAFEVMYQDEKFYIVPQSSILMLEREEDLFE
ncbi:MAG: co-chaperone GroES family protein [Cytophagales bacterium]|nr:co-chaperone GroES family protein [Cytophagales bacterium]